MSLDTLSLKIAQAIAQLWDLYRSGEFLRYLETTFGTEEHRLPNFTCLYIGDTEEGDIRSGPSGALVKHWWQVDDSGMHEISFPKMNWDDSPFFATPKILFYVEGDSVAVLERYGPQKMYRKYATVTFDGLEIRLVSVKVVE